MSGITADIENSVVGLKGSDDTPIGNVGDSLKVTADNAGDQIAVEQPYEEPDRNEQAVQASFSPQALDLLNEILCTMKSMLLEIKRIEHHQRVITDTDFADVTDPLNDEDF